MCNDDILIDEIHRCSNCKYSLTYVTHDLLGLDGGSSHSDCFHPKATGEICDSFWTDCEYWKPRGLGHSDKSSFFKMIHDEFDKPKEDYSKMIGLGDVKNEL